MAYADDDSMGFEAFDPYEHVPEEFEQDGGDDFYPYDEAADAEADAYMSQYDDDPSPYAGDYYEDDGY